VGIFFEPRLTNYASVVSTLEKLDISKAGEAPALGNLHVIPCCYEIGLDLQRVAEQRALDAKGVIRLHSETVYTVYAIGFCPGFPFLGYLPEALTGVPRLATPRLRVEAGSVGLTGRQTGIYTEPRPGGWHLVGRTPLELVNVVDGYFPLRTGDRVQFEPIDESKFKALAGTRLKINHRGTETQRT
jgi:inhibitor of KinA